MFEMIFKKLNLFLFMLNAKKFGKCIYLDCINIHFFFKKHIHILFLLIKKNKFLDHPFLVYEMRFNHDQHLVLFLYKKLVFNLLSQVQTHVL